MIAWMSLGPLGDGRPDPPGHPGKRSDPDLLFGYHDPHLPQVDGAQE
jgi:hypothetical protein